MNKITQIVFAGALLTISATCAAAATISFDDAYAASVFNPATYYKALDGVTISGTYTGVIGGVGNGDPGNWGLGGTNGSAFLGCNQGNSCTSIFTFDTAVKSVSLDLGLRNGSTAAFTVNAYLLGSLVGTDSFSITGTGANGGWQTASFNTTLDQVVVTHTSGNFAFGLDNVVIGTAATTTPEPSTMLLLGAGLISLAHFRRRKMN